MADRNAFRYILSFGLKFKLKSVRRAGIAGKMLCLLALLFGFSAVSQAVNAPGTSSLPVRGWLTHWPDPAYLQRVLEAAPRYRINHLELSHDIVMNVDEVTTNPERARLIESIAAQAAKQHIQTVIWAHELNVRSRDLDLDPASPDGKAFWQSRRDAYKKALEACPSVSGVVLMFGSSPTEVWDVPGRDAFWQKLSMPERIRFVVGQVKSVVCAQFHKQLFARDFNHSPKQLAWLTEALRDQPDITVMSKPEPQDFQFFYPHSPAVGAVGKTPQILEIDLNGEYWGQSLIPVAQVEYLKYRMGYGVGKGIVGAVGRIDTYSNSALGTPSEINLYAYTRLLENPDVSVQAIYDGWLSERYHLQAGSENARRLQAILSRTYRMAQKMYYTQGFWTWKNQASAPETAQSIDRGIIGKSTAQWDARQKPNEAKLIKPDAATVQAILQEKADAVTLAKQNAQELEALRGVLKPEDFADFERRLRLSVDLAHVWEAIAGAYWRVKLAKTDPQAPAAAPEQRAAAIASLEKWADTLAERYADNKPVAAQTAHLRSLAADLRQPLKQ